MAWTFGASGAIVQAANTNTTPLNVAYPSGIAAGQLLLLIVGNPTAGAVFTNSDITTSLKARATNGQLELFGKLATGSESGNMTVSANNSGRVIAQIASFSGAPTTLTGIVHANNDAGGSGLLIPIPSLTISQDNTLVIIAGRKNVNLSSVDDEPGFTEIGELAASTLQHLVWNYQIQTTATNISSDNWACNGDSSVTRNSLIASLLPGTVTVTKGRMLMTGVG